MLGAKYFYAVFLLTKNSVLGEKYSESIHLGLQRQSFWLNLNNRGSWEWDKVKFLYVQLKNIAKE